jgi:hypothetical protein
VKRFALTGMLVLLVAGCSRTPGPPAKEPSAPKAPVLGEGWLSLFDGRSLDGWQAAENPGSFSVRDGMIVVSGPRAHLYYMGDVQKHDFKNFEFRADVMTTPGSNSGIYIHTRYQESDWPRQGYEVQVNHSHADPKKTGSLYDVQNVMQSPAEDKVWFTEQIVVRGKRIITKVNDKTLVDYTEPENPQRPEGWEGRRLSSGTFALQAHDPKSKVYFANIMVKPLPD